MKVNAACRVSVICYANTRGPPHPTKPFWKRFGVKLNRNCTASIVRSGQYFFAFVRVTASLAPACVLVPPPKTHYRKCSLAAKRQISPVRSMDFTDRLRSISLAAGEFHCTALRCSATTQNACGSYYRDKAHGF